MKKEAMLYEKKDNNSVFCLLCARQCTIAEGETGFCGVRRNVRGKLYTAVYGKPAAVNIDPIEKKPLYHFLPGSKIFSLGTLGCNFKCGFCQNWQISQSRPAEADSTAVQTLPAEAAADTALKSGCAGIAFTYNEPTVFFEYAYDTAKQARERGLRSVFVTNGYMTERALDVILPFLHAANVDLKSFRDDYYAKNCRASLKPVLETIERMKKLGIWIEITTLIIPGKNDSPEELSDIAEFIASVGVEIPWHVSRFHSDYKFNEIEDTPPETLQKAAEAGKKAGLRYIYQGNTTQGTDTECSKCGRTVIERGLFNVKKITLLNGKCPACSTAVDGIWD